MVYFLHVEPEAFIQINTIFESQLAVIKMLSETLPTGWKLYVKEHPAQFDVNSDLGYYHMVDMPRFKTKEFYKKIASMPNVELVDINVKSEVLVENAQAVSSILGTVFFESVLKNKPVIMFSDQNLVAFMRDSFVINSFDDCRNAMEKIANGFTPDYSDADEVIKKYVFKGEYIAENIMGLLKREFEE